ncbi:hypothetical protein AVEN_262963-1 [Araneus ventricosus]|uniref:Transposase Tc1-like domain-containing protein n=1 Tax=Araneus ventricosus TaxID=182803 RepID=A0A4Y2DJQ6_ARAVE|nr:hypothetical protein AVEN_262963-1 [Araneus ventricosus]
MAPGSKPDFTKDQSCSGPVDVTSYIWGQTSSRWCGGEVWRGGASSGVVLVICPWFKMTRDQNASRRLGSGRRRIATTADDRYLLQCARRRRTLTARQLVSQLSVTARRSISRQTVSRRLHRGGLLTRRSVVCVPLSPERGCIEPMNIAVGHQSSGTTYSLRMSLDLRSRMIHEGK